MMKISNLGWVCLLLAASIAADANAAGEVPESKQCTIDTTIIDCWDKYVADARTPVQALKDDDIQAAVKRNQANIIGGLDSGSSVSSANSKDFRHLFSAIFEAADLDDANTLVLTWNPEFLGLNESEFQVQTSIRKAAIFSEIEKAIPEAARAGRKAVLEKELGDLDDVSYSISYAPQGKNFGRKFSSHMVAKFENLRTANDSLVQKEIRLAENEVKLARFMSSISKLMNDFKVADEQGAEFDEKKVTFKQLVAGGAKKECDSTCESEAKRLIAALERVLWDLREGESAIAVVDRSGLAWDFGVLLQNQPQLTFTYTHDSRGSLAGPDSDSLAVVYERGFPSLSSFEWLSKGASKHLSSDEVKEYREKLKRSLQITISAEYGETSPLDFEISGSEGFPDAIPIDLKRVTSKELSVSLSRALTFDGDDKPTSSLALSFKYVDVSNDEKLRDQGIGLLTYTLKVNDALDLPLTLVYANHTRYLEEEDEAVSAHFALRYKLKKVTKAKEDG